jgi:gamma-glutamyltranspeptidase/glutathione hydrolase
MPGMLSRKGRLLGAFGVIGGTFQPQGNLQILHHLLERSLPPSQAIAQPRFRIFSEDPAAAPRIALEPLFDEDQVDGLEKLGLLVDFPSAEPVERFGNAQIAMVSSDGSEPWGSDPRWDGTGAEGT